MKNLSLLVWLTQLALSVALPLVAFVLLGVWLQGFWGTWALIVAVLLGLLFAVNGLRYSLRLMDQQAKKEDKESPSLSFNEHD